MPFLDMSDAGFLDPELIDFFGVLRQSESISDHGRSVVRIQRFPRVFGNVNQASPNDMERLGDFQITTGAISIVSKFKLFDASMAGTQSTSGQKYQPDVIEWAGSYYIVKTLENYSRYGFGFIQAICIETSFVGTTPQDGVAIPSFDFSNPKNSGYLACL